MLHITNGDVAAGQLHAAGLPGLVVPWRDPLHEGPVPAVAPRRLRKIRASYIADCGWDVYEGALSDMEARDAAIGGAGAHDEIVLWFEHDLYDQLQLLQALDTLHACATDTRISWVLTTSYLGEIPTAFFPELFEEREAVPPQAMEEARAAWAAFRQATPDALQDLLRADLGAIPHLGPALQRHLQEFPWAGTGLSRTERQLLEALADGPRTIAQAYRAAHHAREEAIFLGDSVFTTYVARLSRGPHPALTGSDGHEVRPPRPGQGGDYWSQPIAITDDGRSVLSAEADWVRLAGVGRWLGGVHLVGRETPWRWDDAAGVVVRSS